MLKTAFNMRSFLKEVRMDLYIKQKVFSIGDKYNVFDEFGELVFEVKSELFSFGAKLHILDTRGYEIMSIHREVFSFLPRYTVYENGIARASVKRKFSLLSKFEIADKQGLFNVDGDYFSMDFSITTPDGNLLGSIEKEWLSWGDTYKLSVANPAHAAFFCALVIAIDECMHNNRD